MSDCDVLRCLLPAAWESDNKVGTDDNNDKWEYCGGRAAPPRFQFQTLAQTAEAKAIWIETVCFMLDVRGTFGHEAEQSFPILLSLNNNGGMDNEFPNTTPVKGRWVIIKCDSSLG
jgi:hypothetical protein